MLQIAHEVFCYFTVVFGLYVFIIAFLRRVVIGEGGPEAFPIKSLCVFLICIVLYFGFALYLGNMLSALKLWLRTISGAFIISLGIGSFVLERSYKLVFAFLCLVPGTAFGSLWFIMRFYAL